MPFRASEKLAAHRRDAESAEEEKSQIKCFLCFLSFSAVNSMGFAKSPFLIQRNKKASPFHRRDSEVVESNAEKASRGDSKRPEVFDLANNSKTPDPR